MLAHRLSLVTSYAGALEYRHDAPPDQLAGAAGVIRASVHQALGELRDVIAVLRDPESAADWSEHPKPVLADLPGLMEEASSAGTHIQLDNRLDGSAALPAAVGRTAYRVVQEALTNAREACSRPASSGDPLRSGRDQAHD